MADKEKKRKRSTEDGDKPSKKAAVTSSKASINVRFPALQGELHPVIVSSPGVNVPSTSFQTWTRPDAWKEKASNKTAPDAPTPSTHSLILHSSAHPKLDYTAHQDSDPNLVHYIGVFDPATSSLQVLPAHALTLRTNLRSETAEVHAQNAARSFAKQREELGMEFGTKKAKKAITSKTENAITSGAARKEQGAKLDAVEAAVMDSVKEAADAMPERKDMNDSVLASKPIPRPNLDATKLEDVYPISHLIPSVDLRNVAVKDWQDAVAAGEEVKLNYRFIARRLVPVGESGDVQKLKAMKYLQLLLDFNFALQPGRGGKKIPVKDKFRAKMAEWPETLIESVRRKFADGNELNKWHMDLLLTYMAAISLYIDGWKSDTFDLQEDLRLDVKQMSQYFNELGCKTDPPTEKERDDFKIPNKASAAQRRIAKLRLPLVFPKVRVPSTRRR